MKPIKAVDVTKEVLITTKFLKVHSGPVCIGCPERIGIMDVSKPDYGDPVDVYDDEVPIIHACGVTPQSVLMQNRLEFAMTYSPGHIFGT